MLCSVLMAAMIILPLTTMEKPHKTAVVDEKPSVNTESGAISVMKSESGKVEKTDIKEYTVGALAAEMSMECHDEALKAQAVARGRGIKTILTERISRMIPKLIRDISIRMQGRKSGATSMPIMRKRRKSLSARCSGKE